MRPRLAWLVLLLLAFALQGFGGKHPVPLDENVESAKCLECHENKAKGAAVHTAVAMGCRTCHEVRVIRGITRTKLTKTTATALCLSCHTDKNAAETKGRVHSPAVRDCLKCHEAHTASDKNLLVKDTTGDKNENLCLSCHATGVNAHPKGSRHAALDMGCATCHVTHKTGTEGEREFDFHLVKTTPALCVECHDVKDAALAGAHQQQPFAGGDCLTCHDAHESNSPKLLQKFTHQPFADKACDTCHAAPKDGIVVLTAAEPRALCVTCHEETVKKIEGAKVQHAGALGDCTQCHDPHGGKTPGFARPNPVAACLNCHADQAALRKTKKVLHQPAFEQGCAICHQPHGGDKPKLLRAEGNALCMNCHTTDIKPQKVEGAELVSVFEGTVRLPENYFNKVPRLRLKYGLGHPTARHPVSDYTDPLDAKKVTKISCQTCHQPHAGAAKGMLVNDTRSTVQFCRTCHQGMIGAN